MRQIVRRVGNSNHVYTYNGNRLVGFTAITYHNQRKVGENTDACNVYCTEKLPNSTEDEFDQCVNDCNNCIEDNGDNSYAVSKCTTEQQSGSGLRMTYDECMGTCEKEEDYDVCYDKCSHLSP